MLALFLSLSLATAAPVESVVLLTTGASVCAGVAISPDRIATAYHCIAGGGRPMVEDEAGNRAVGRVVFARPRDDLAIVEVELGTASSALAKATSEPGAVVQIVGHPFAASAPGGFLAGLLRYSISQGVVSAVGPRALQTTAPVNPGNSGGPVFNEEGEVTGIVSRRLRGDGLGFATRVERLAALIEDEQRPSPFGGTLGLHVSASAWSGTSGTATVGAEAWLSFRDRVVLSGGGSLPLSPRWDAIQFSRIAWIEAEGRAAVRQRLFRGRYTSHVEGYGGLASLATMTGDRETLRRSRSSVLAPMVGASVGFGSVVLDAGWVFASDGAAIRGQMRFAWPGKLWIF